MSINELTVVVPPPNSPTDVPPRADWKNIEKTLGLSLPADYKDFVRTYGSGVLGNFIIVANPFSLDEGIGLLPVVNMLCDTLRELKESDGDQGVPFDIHPDAPGLLPWGGDENGNGLYWLTEGQPDEWRCVVGAGRDSRWQQFDVPMTTFLAKTLSGDMTCKIWPSGFAKPKRRRVFTPY